MGYIDIPVYQYNPYSYPKYYTDDIITWFAGIHTGSRIDFSFFGDTLVLWDHASYAVAGYLIEYFVALYVFCHNSHEVYKGDSSHCDYDYIREQVRKWNNSVIIAREYYVVDCLMNG